MDSFSLRAQPLLQDCQQAYRPVQHSPAHSCMKTQEKFAMSAMVYCPAASHSRPSLRCFSITPYNLLVSFVYLLTPYSIFSGAYLTKWFAWPCMGPRPPCKSSNRVRGSCGVATWCIPSSKPSTRQCKKAQILQQICLPLGTVHLQSFKSSSSAVHVVVVAYNGRKESPSGT